MKVKLKIVMNRHQHFEEQGNYIFYVKKNTRALKEFLFFLNETFVYFCS